MRIAIIGTILLAALALSAQNLESRSDVRVADAATAIRIAEPALAKIYGKRQIDNEKPFTAVLENGIWHVYGTLCCPNRNGGSNCDVGQCRGGVAEMKIRQTDGKILSITHGR
jgi:hypothetical protein